MGNQYGKEGGPGYTPPSTSTPPSPSSFSKGVGKKTSDVVPSLQGEGEKIPGGFLEGGRGGGRGEKGEDNEILGLNYAPFLINQSHGEVEEYTECNRISGKQQLFSSQGNINQCKTLDSSQYMIKKPVRPDRLNVVPDHLSVSDFESVAYNSGQPKLSPDHTATLYGTSALQHQAGSPSLSSSNTSLASLSFRSSGNIPVQPRTVPGLSRTSACSSPYTCQTLNIQKLNSYKEGGQFVDDKSLEDTSASSSGYTSPVHSPQTRGRRKMPFFRRGAKSKEKGTAGASNLGATASLVKGLSFPIAISAPHASVSPPTSPASSSGEGRKSKVTQPQNKKLEPSKKQVLQEKKVEDITTNEKTGAKKEGKQNEESKEKAPQSQPWWAFPARRNTNPSLVSDNEQQEPYRRLSNASSGSYSRRSSTTSLSSARTTPTLAKRYKPPSPSIRPKDGVLTSDHANAAIAALLGDRCDSRTSTGYHSVSQTSPAIQAFRNTPMMEKKLFSVRRASGEFGSGPFYQSSGSTSSLSSVGVNEQTSVKSNQTNLAKNNQSKLVEEKEQSEKVESKDIDETKSLETPNKQEKDSKAPLPKWVQPAQQNIDNKTDKGAVKMQNNTVEVGAAKQEVGGGEKRPPSRALSPVSDEPEKLPSWVKCQETAEKPPLRSTKPRVVRGGQRLSRELSLDSALMSPMSPMSPSGVMSPQGPLSPSGATRPGPKPPLLKSTTLDLAEVAAKCEHLAKSAQVQGRGEGVGQITSSSGSEKEEKCEGNLKLQHKKSAVVSGFMQKGETERNTNLNKPENMQSENKSVKVENKTLTVESENKNGPQIQNLNRKVPQVKSNDKMPSNKSDTSHQICSDENVDKGSMKALLSPRGSGDFTNTNIQNLNANTNRLNPNINKTTIMKTRSLDNRQRTDASPRHSQDLSTWKRHSLEIHESGSQRNSQDLSFIGRRSSRELPDPGPAELPSWVKPQDNAEGTTVRTTARPRVVRAGQRSSLEVAEIDLKDRLSQEKETKTRQPGVQNNNLSNVEKKGGDSSNQQQIVKKDDQNFTKMIVDNKGDKNDVLNTQAQNIVKGKVGEKEAISGDVTQTVQSGQKVTKVTGTVARQIIKEESDKQHTGDEGQGGGRSSSGGSLKNTSMSNISNTDSSKRCISDNTDASSKGKQTEKQIDSSRPQKQMQDDKMLSCSGEKTQIKSGDKTVNKTSQINKETGASMSGKQVQSDAQKSVNTPSVANEQMSNSVIQNKIKGSAFKLNRDKDTCVNDQRTISVTENQAICDESMNSDKKDIKKVNINSSVCGKTSASKTGTNLYGITKEGGQLEGSISINSGASSENVNKVTSNDKLGVNTAQIHPHPSKSAAIKPVCPPHDVNLGETQGAGKIKSVLKANAPTQPPLPPPRGKSQNPPGNLKHASVKTAQNKSQPPDILPTGEVGGERGGSEHQKEGKREVGVKGNNPREDVRFQSTNTVVLKTDHESNLTPIQAQQASGARGKNPQVQGNLQIQSQSESQSLTDPKTESVKLPESYQNKSASGKPAIKPKPDFLLKKQHGEKKEVNRDQRKVSQQQQQQIQQQQQQQQKQLKPQKQNPQQQNQQQKNRTEKPNQRTRNIEVKQNTMKNTNQQVPETPSHQGKMEKGNQNPPNDQSLQVGKENTLVDVSNQNMNTKQNIQTQKAKQPAIQTKNMNPNSTRSQEKILQNKNSEEKNTGAFLNDDKNDDKNTKSVNTNTVKNTLLIETSLQAQTLEVKPEASSSQDSKYQTGSATSSAPNERVNPEHMLFEEGGLAQPDVLKSQNVPQGYSKTQVLNTTSMYSPAQDLDPITQHLAHQETSGKALLSTGELDDKISEEGQAGVLTESINISQVKSSPSESALNIKKVDVGGSSKVIIDSHDKNKLASDKLREGGGSEEGRGEGFEEGGGQVVLSDGSLEEQTFSKVRSSHLESGSGMGNTQKGPSSGGSLQDSNIVTSHNGQMMVQAAAVSASSSSPSTTKHEHPADMSQANRSSTQSKGNITQPKGLEKAKPNQTNLPRGQNVTSTSAGNQSEAKNSAGRKTEGQAGRGVSGATHLISSETQDQKGLITESSLSDKRSNEESLVVESQNRIGEDKERGEGKEGGQKPQQQPSSGVSTSTVQTDTAKDRCVTLSDSLSDTSLITTTTPPAEQSHLSSSSGNSVQGETPKFHSNTEGSAAACDQIDQSKPDALSSAITGLVNLNTRQENSNKLPETMYYSPSVSNTAYVQQQPVEQLSTQAPPGGSLLTQQHGVSAGEGQVVPEGKMGKGTESKQSPQQVGQLPGNLPSAQQTMVPQHQQKVGSKPSSNLYQPSSVEHHAIHAPRVPGGTIYRQNYPQGNVHSQNQPFNLQRGILTSANVQVVRPTVIVGSVNPGVRDESLNKNTQGQFHPRHPLPSVRSAPPAPVGGNLQQGSGIYHQHQSEKYHTEQDQSQLKKGPIPQPSGIHTLTHQNLAQNKERTPSVHKEDIQVVRVSPQVVSGGPGNQQTINQQYTSQQTPTGPTVLPPPVSFQSNMGLGVSTDAQGLYQPINNAIPQQVQGIQNVGLPSYIQNRPTPSMQQYQTGPPLQRNQTQVQSGVAPGGQHGFVGNVHDQNVTTQGNLSIDTNMVQGVQVPSLQIHSSPDTPPGGYLTPPGGYMTPPGPCSPVVSQVMPLAHQAIMSSLKEEEKQGKSGGNMDLLSVRCESVESTGLSSMEYAMSDEPVSLDSMVSANINPHSPVTLGADIVNTNAGHLSQSSGPCFISDGQKQHEQQQQQLQRQNQQQHKNQQYQQQQLQKQQLQKQNQQQQLQNQQYQQQQLQKQNQQYQQQQLQKQQLQKQQLQNQQQQLQMQNKQQQLLKQNQQQQLQNQQYQQQQLQTQQYQQHQLQTQQYQQQQRQSRIDQQGQRMRQSESGQELHGGMVYNATPPVQQIVRKPVPGVPIPKPRPSLSPQPIAEGKPEPTFTSVPPAGPKINQPNLPHSQPVNIVSSDHQQDQLIYQQQGAPQQTVAGRGGGGARGGGRGRGGRQRYIKRGSNQKVQASGPQMGGQVYGQMYQVKQVVGHQAAVQQTGHQGAVQQTVHQGVVQQTVPAPSPSQQDASLNASKTTTIVNQHMESKVQGNLARVTPVPTPSLPVGQGVVSNSSNNVSSSGVNKQNAKQMDLNQPQQSINESVKKESEAVICGPDYQGSAEFKGQGQMYPDSATKQLSIDTLDIKPSEAKIEKGTVMVPPGLSMNQQAKLTGFDKIPDKSTSQVSNQEGHNRMVESVVSSDGNTNVSRNVQGDTKDQNMSSENSEENDSGEVYVSLDELDWEEEERGETGNKEITERKPQSDNESLPSSSLPHEGREGLSKTSNEQTCDKITKTDNCDVTVDSISEEANKNIPEEKIPATLNLDDADKKSDSTSSEAEESESASEEEEGECGSHSSVKNEEVISSGKSDGKESSSTESSSDEEEEEEEEEEGVEKKGKERMNKTGSLKREKKKGLLFDTTFKFVKPEFVDETDKRVIISREQLERRKEKEEDEQQKEEDWVSAESVQTSFTCKPRPGLSASAIAKKEKKLAKRALKQKKKLEKELKKKQKKESKNKKDGTTPKSDDGIKETGKVICDNKDVISPTTPSDNVPCDINNKTQVISETRETVDCSHIITNEEMLAPIGAVGGHLPTNMQEKYALEHTTLDAGVGTCDFSGDAQRWDPEDDIYWDIMDPGLTLSSTISIEHLGTDISKPVEEFHHYHQNWWAVSKRSIAVQFPERTTVGINVYPAFVVGQQYPEKRNFGVTVDMDREESDLSDDEDYASESSWEEWCDDEWSAGEGEISDSEGDKIVMPRGRSRPRIRGESRVRTRSKGVEGAVKEKTKAFKGDAPVERQKRKQWKVDVKAMGGGVVRSSNYGPT